MIWIAFILFFVGLGIFFVGYAFCGFAFIASPGAWKKFFRWKG